MRHPQARLLAAPALVLWLTSLCAAGQVATLGFDPIPPGTFFGEAYGDVPGPIILIEDDIKFSLAPFLFEGSPLFYEAAVDGRFASVFPTPALELNNITGVFDFSGVPFEIDEVTFEYREFGGLASLSVNGFSAVSVESLVDLPVSVAPGIQATVDSVRITLSGPVNMVQIGGQELVVDTVVAVPEPATLLLLGAGVLAIIRRRTQRQWCLHS